MATKGKDLEELVKQELGTVTLKNLGFSGGGCINECQSYNTDHGKIFVKFNAKSEVRATEKSTAGSHRALPNTALPMA